MNRLPTVVACLVAAGAAAAGAPAGTFAGRLEPAPAGGGFRMDDFWVWCGSVARG